MADGSHLEKFKNSHIFAIDCPIGTKFGTVMHINPENRTGS